MPEPKQDMNTLTNFQARVIETLARIETSQMDQTRRMADIERRQDEHVKTLDANFVRKERVDQIEDSIGKIETVLNKAIWGIFGIVSSVITSALVAVFKFGLPK